VTFPQSTVDAQCIQGLLLQGSPKTGTLCFVRLNFIKYWPLFKLISLSKSEEHL